MNSRGTKLIFYIIKEVLNENVGVMLHAVKAGNDGAYRKRCKRR